MFAYICHKGRTSERMHCAKGLGLVHSNLWKDTFCANTIHKVQITNGKQVLGCIVSPLMLLKYINFVIISDTKYEICKHTSFNQ